MLIQTPACRNCSNPRRSCEVVSYGTICEDCWVAASSGFCPNNPSRKPKAVQNGLFDNPRRDRPASVSSTGAGG